MKKIAMIVLSALSLVSAAIANEVTGLHLTAGQSGDSIVDAIVTHTDVAITSINDATYPWTIEEDAIKNGNCGIAYSTSTISFKYQSNYQSEVSFDWLSYSYYQHNALRVYVDGISQGYTNNSSYTHKRLYIEPGEHIVTFKDSIGNSSSTYNYSYIKNLQIREIRSLESVVLSPNSEPLSFTNDETWPWTLEDEYIQNSNYGNKNTTSKFSTSFSISVPSKFSFWSSTNFYDGNNAYDYSGYHYFDFKINGERYIGRENGSGTTCVLLEPGEYTMEWCDSIYNNTYTVKTRVSNIELSSNWIDVELASAGSLGVEVLYKVNVLTDIELLKVKGNLNATDWTNIKQMKNIIALDLSDAKFDEIPNNAFEGLSRLSSVKLPEGLLTIGASSFMGTQILNIDIPSTVTRIEQSAFQGTRVRSVNFKEDAQLQFIGYYAFINCSSLKEFIMPNSVTQLGSYNNYYSSDYDTSILSGCTSLKKVHFSEALTTLEQYVCYKCTNLEEVDLPSNLKSIRDYAFYSCDKLRHIDLPSSLDRIDYYAFYQCGLDSISLPLTLSALENDAFRNCDNLRYIELPSYIGNYDRNFYDCSNVEKIVCQSATPPSISTDPFQNGRAKGEMTLVVPSFAVVNYKLDPYWYQFGSIVEGDDIDYWKIAGNLSLTNNRRMNGKPDIDLYDGGKLVVGGAAPMEVGVFNYFEYEPNPACLLNDCPSFTADEVNTYFYFESGKWYFFTPTHDVDLTKVYHTADASFVFRYYDGSSRATNGTGNSWRNVDNGKLIAGQGYIFQCNANGYMVMPSDVNDHSKVFTTSDVTKQLAAYEAPASANKSWNYVGNPYPAYYDIYYMDFTAPITVWTGNTYKAYSIADDDFVLRPMQSFFVQKPDAVDAIVFHKEGRQIESTVNRASYAKPRNAHNVSGNRKFFNLQISGDEVTDETRIVVNEDATLAYELECDASKFLSMESNAPQLFSMDEEGNLYAINERPLNNGCVKLGYSAGKPGFYTISATRLDGDAVLFDRIQNRTITLNDQDYTFYSDSTEGIDNNRFVLTLNVNTEETAIETIEFDELTSGNSLFDLQGHKVKDATKGIFIQNGHKIVK